MFINDQIIYLHLQKTGGTHVTRLLTEYLGGTNPCKHGRLDRAVDGRTVIGSVRNPWDWYVSLFAYGCMGDGAIKGCLTTGRSRLALQTLRAAARYPDRWPKLPQLMLRQAILHDTSFWRRIYADAADISAFREWLYAIHTPQIQNMVFEDTRPMPLHGFAGLYSARVVYLYSDIAAWDTMARKISSQSSLDTFYRTHSVLDRTIKTESLVIDLAAIIADVGRLDITASILEQHGKTNASKRASVERYYDKDTIALVADRDRLVVDLFGYTGPSFIDEKT